MIEEGLQFMNLSDRSQLCSFYEKSNWLKIGSKFIVFVVLSKIQDNILIRMCHDDQECIKQ